MGVEGKDEFRHQQESRKPFLPPDRQFVGAAGGRPELRSFHRFGGAIANPLEVK